MTKKTDYNFSRVPSINIPRSSFDRSHGYKTTFDSGYLVPFYVDEALPGDTFTMRANLFCRLSTPIVPFMDNLRLETFYFAVPVRLIWENWQRFNGEQDNPGDSTDYLVPQISSGASGFDVGSLSDYFGVPVDVPNLKVSALWHRAYNLIWNEWFRDENLQDSCEVPKGDGPDSATDFKLLKRGKRHDYFTSALPWPQKGPGVELPIGDSAPVYGDGNSLAWKGLKRSSQDFDYFGMRFDSNDNVVAGRIGPIGSSSSHMQLESGTAIGMPIKADGVSSGLYADLSSVASATINSLRQAFQVQKLLEKDARGGTRYTEILRSHFGVISPDARLQRPEFLGSGSTRINVNPVQQTSSTDGTSPQGNLAAFGLGSLSGHAFSKSFVEHCVIIGLVNVRADLTYQQGVPRMFSRRTRFDYYWPSFAHLGEQAVLNKEIYAQGNDDDDEPFGYQERWSEYRYFPSKITGKFRSGVTGSLDVWHLAQKFNGLPQLNEEFIVENVPVKRVLAVQNEPEFLLDTFLQLRCVRPMPVYSVPGLIDHF